MGRKSLERVSQREYARRLGVSNEAVSKAIREGRINKGWDKAAEKIIVDHANLEWGALHMKTNINSLLQQEPNDYNSIKPDVDSISTNSRANLSLNGNSSFAEAKRVREIIGAQIAGLELMQKKGELVKKEEVFKQLFSFGQEIRTAIMATPDRIIDAILNSKNRSEAHQILTGQLHEILESLTKIDFDFQPRQ